MNPAGANRQTCEAKIQSLSRTLSASFNYDWFRTVKDFNEQTFLFLVENCLKNPADLALCYRFRNKFIFGTSGAVKRNWFRLTSKKVRKVSLLFLFGFYKSAAKLLAKYYGLEKEDCDEKIRK